LQQGLWCLYCQQPLEFLTAEPLRARRRKFSIGQMYVLPVDRPTASKHSFIHSFIHSYQFINTHDDRTYHAQWKACGPGIQQTRMIKECQYTCFYNVRTTKLLSYSLMSFGMRLSITGSRPLVAVWFCFCRIVLLCNKTT